MNSKILIALALLLVVDLASCSFGCGCFGQGTCDLNGNFARESGCNDVDQLNNLAFCDCCPPCNSCPQLFAGCFAAHMHTDLMFSPSVPHEFVLGEEITASELPVHHNIFEVCIQPELPMGLNLTQNNFGVFVLQGTPLETLPTTSYDIIAKGSSSYIGKTTIAFRVVLNCAAGGAIQNAVLPDEVDAPVEVTPEPYIPEFVPETPSIPEVNEPSQQVPVIEDYLGGGCTFGNERCTGHSTYVTCIQNEDGTARWSSETQDCPPMSQCAPFQGAFIICQ